MLSQWGLDPLQGNPRYQSIRTLNQSGRTFLQLALDRTTGEKVAIKFTQRGWDEGQNKYMLRELLIHQELSACHHPHIVELKDVFLTPVHLAAVHEYVEGEDLQTFLSNTGGRVSEALGRFLFQQLVLALDFCHARGKVSRGVKLANTLLALSPGQLPLVKLADFGFSKDTGRHSAPASQVGTALFVPPEVMHNFNQSPYNGALVDVWACGIVLFMLLFGRHPCLRPEDSGLSEQQQMLALFTRTAASQFCLLPEEAAAISPACADLLGHMLKTDPKERYSMAQIQSHPWFKQGLPEGAALMNATILAEAAARPLTLRHSPEALAALIRHGQRLDRQVMNSRFGSSQAAAAAAGGGSSGTPTAAVNIPNSPPNSQDAAAAAAAAEGHRGGSAIGARVASSSAAVGSMDEDHHMPWGAPPPARLLIHSSSSSDKAQGFLYKQQEQQMLRSGQIPPARFHMSESMSSNQGSFLMQQQQQDLGNFLETIPSAPLEDIEESPQLNQLHLPQQQQHQQQLQQQQQLFNMWAPQQQAPSSTTTSAGTVAGTSPPVGGGHSAVYTGGVHSGGVHSAPAGTVSPSQVQPGMSQSVVSAPNLQGSALQQQVQQQQAQLQALQLQQQQQQQQQQHPHQQQQQQQLAAAVNGARNISLLNSAELETLLPLDSGVPGSNPAGTNQQPDSAAAAAAARGIIEQNSFMQLIQGIDSLPLNALEGDIDSLLNPADNPLLSQPIPDQYAAQQQQLQQQQQPQQASQGSPYSSGPVASPVGASPASSGYQQQQQQHQGIEIPDDYAAFLVDEDDLAAVAGEGVAGQRKRVMSGAGAGISSCSLDLRKLSDLLMGGSSMQLLEGSTWHKLCKNSFTRAGHSGPAAVGGDTVRPGDTVDDAAGGHQDDEDDLHALLGLRDMSITQDCA